MYSELLVSSPLFPPWSSYRRDSRRWGDTPATPCLSWRSVRDWRIVCSVYRGLPAPLLWGQCQSYWLCYWHQCHHTVVGNITITMHYSFTNGLLMSGRQIKITRKRADLDKMTNKVTASGRQKSIYNQW